MKPFLISCFRPSEKEKKVKRLEPVIYSNNSYTSNCTTSACSNMNINLNEDIPSRTVTKKKPSFKKSLLPSMRLQSVLNRYSKYNISVSNPSTKKRLSLDEKCKSYPNLNKLDPSQNSQKLPPRLSLGSQEKYIYLREFNDNTSSSHDNSSNSLPLVKIL